MTSESPARGKTPRANTAVAQVTPGTKWCRFNLVVPSSESTLPVPVGALKSCQCVTTDSPMDSESPASARTPSPAGGDNSAVGGPGGFNASGATASGNSESDSATDQSDDASDSADTVPVFSAEPWNLSEDWLTATTSEGTLRWLGLKAAWCEAVIACRSSACY